jgi:hypothetical protein
LPVVGSGRLGRSEQEGAHVSQKISQDVSAERCGDDWLFLLRELAAELEAGMVAIAANQVGVFEQCVERQQTLCRRRDRHVAAQRAAVLAEDRPDAVLSRQMRAAAERLRTLNARYASLLGHSGRALRMFSALEQGGERYLPAVPGASMIRKARPSWSCEG